LTKLKAVLPVYYQIMQTIKGWILTKELGPGEKLPSENELAKKFHVSRLTVRQAISQLVQQGLLYSSRGEKTLVTDNEQLVLSLGIEFHGPVDELLIHQMLKVKPKSVTISRIAPPRLVKEKLGLDNGTGEVIQIKRVIYLKDRLSKHTTSFLPVEIGSKIREKDLYKKTLLTILEQDLNIRFTEAVQTIEASFADQEVAQALEIASGSPMLLVQRVMFDADRKPVELYSSLLRGDVYKFMLRLKNVETKDGRKWKYT
jgi:GntR family transcriptional regulator